MRKSDAIIGRFVALRKKCEEIDNGIQYTCVDRLPESFVWCSDEQPLVGLLDAIIVQLKILQTENHSF